MTKSKRDRNNWNKIHKPGYSFNYKKGRKRDTRVLYNPKQTQRYESQWSRYEQGMAMAIAHIPHLVQKTPKKIYRIPSDRSPVGYWQIEKKEAGGNITLLWEGEKIKKPFEEREVFACGVIQVWVGWAYRAEGIGQPVFPTSYGDFYTEYVRQTRSTRSPFQVLTDNGYDGTFNEFNGGNWQGLAGNGIGSPIPGIPSVSCDGVYFFIFFSGLYPTGQDIISLIESQREAALIPSHYEIIQAQATGPEQEGVCELPYFYPGSVEKRTFSCEYELSAEEFSLNWFVVSEAGVIQNDRGQQKTVSACTPPEPLSNIKLKSVVKVEGEEGSGWKCNCPDYAKKEGAFSPPLYPSMSQERDWTASDAGCPTWSDGARRCKHIVAVQAVEGEEIPVPDDIPLGNEASDDYGEGDYGDDD